jgi:hypothetical protein
MKPSNAFYFYPFNIAQSVFSQSAFEPSSGVRESMQQAATNFWNGQEQVLSAMHEYANAWFERRQAGVSDALEASEQMTKAATPVEAFREYQKWAVASLERTIDDGVSCQKQLLLMGSLLAPSISPLGERTETEPAATEQRRRTQSRAAAA